MNKLLGYFSRHDRGWVLSLIAAVSLIYFPYLGNPFFFDDGYLFTGNVMSHYAHSMFHFDLRWFSYVTLGWTAALFSDVVPHFYHLGNLLVHSANAILLFYLLRQIVGAVSPDTHDSPQLKRGAWVAALLFALHPVAVYAVGYVVQRSILMATLFVLLMQLAYLRGLMNGQVRWLGLSVLCYFLAVFSKEHSVLAPATLAALTLLLWHENAASKRALWLTWGAFMAVAILVTLRARGVLGAAYEPMAAELFEQQGVVASTPMLHLLSALTQMGLFFKYLLLWLLPNVSWMSVDMREPFVAALSDWRGWLGLLAFTAYGAVAFKLLLRGGMKGLIGFALLYPWMQFGVELAGIRVQEPFVLYRSYLWMPGMLLLIPLLLLKFPQRITLVTLICAAILMIPLAWNRLWVFGDDYRLWNDAVLKLKNERVAGADRIYFNRGQALMKAKKWEAAASDFERSAAISPQLAPIHRYLADAYSNSGQYQKALIQYDQAIDLNHRDAGTYFGKGMVLKRLHRNDEARQQMVRSCNLGYAVACFLVSTPQIDKH
ncbi:tetratricopeptide repeat protein [Sideroxydans lithotrophicus]|uniref:Tetratricopeptide TPR_2 repeat protein n=1 Tax=Sideroxydans lithotrophicus (strain ES-1) TaxID=580332 RepID=D5CMU3_SIDLE|nr:tetratricopeptide repeat protein [Sideroxydans lithotrophicus]ADE10779.1 Tetratricopeptide TPR_2 repeat protein [Sideroxydans lithotrophicus ES-1]